PPVDDDPDGIRMKEARAAHGDASFEAYFRSTLTSPTGQELFADLGIDDPAEQLEIMFDQARLDTALRGRPDLRRALQDSPMFDDERAAQVAADLLADISDSGVPAYLWDGWRDPHPHDRLMMYANLTSPRRLAMGPWAHGPLDPFDQREKEAENILAVESLRWYDRWVKDVPNGIDEEPSLAWCTEAAGPRWRWHHSDAWPLADAQRVVHRLGGGPSGTLDAGNDGVLSSDEVEPGRDSFTVDYAATTGTQTTYHSATGGGAIDLPDMRVNDTRGLAYTSEPLTEEVTVAGTPIFHLFVTADAPDTTFVVHVEEVLPNGRSELIKQGFLRASHRSLRELPYDNLGAPFFSSLPQDVGATAPLDDGVAELVIGTEPMARTFSVGNRIRVTITGADEGVVWSVPDERPPTITLLRDADHPSHVSLPIWRPPS
ncbi:MAG TPA: CocE/NonD family hydrolase, partial [Nitriliruptorales bacterium]